MPQYGAVILRYFPEYRKKNNDEAKKFVFSSLFFSFLWSLLLFISLELLADLISTHYYNKGSLAPFLRISAITILVSSTSSIAQGFLMSLERFKAVSIGSIILSLLNLLLTVLFIMLGFGINGLIYSIILSQLVVLIYYISLMKSWILIKKPKLSKEILNFWYPIGLATFLKNFTTNLPVLIIGRFLSFEAVGFYDISMRTANLVFSIFTPYTNTLKVVCMNTFHESKKEFSHILNLGIKHLTIGVFFVTGLVLFFPEQILSILYSEKYIPAAPLFVFILIYSGIAQLNFFQRIVYFAYDRSQIYLFAATISTVLQVILLLFFIPIFGLIGIGYSLLVFSILALIIAIILSRYIGERIKIRNMLVPMTLFTFIFIPFRFADFELHYLIFFAIMLSLLYTVTLCMTHYLEWKEMIKIFQRIMKNFISVRASR